jgi:hypothetical protein
MEKKLEEGDTHEDYSWRFNPQAEEPNIWAELRN